MGTDGGDGRIGEFVLERFGTQIFQQERTNLRLRIARKVPNFRRGNGRILFRFQRLTSAGVGCVAIETTDVLHDLEPNAGVRLLGRGQQRFQRVIAVRGAQRPRGLEADAIKRVVVQELFEFRDGFFVTAAGQLLEGQEASNDVAVFAKLRVEHGRGQIERDFDEESVIRIEANDLWRRVESKIKVLFFGSHMERAVGRAERAFEANGRGQIKKQNIFAQLLDLADGELGQLRALIPTVGDIKFRVVGMIDPLIEELIVRAAREFFNNGSKILGNNAAVSVAFEVGLDTAPIQLLAKL